MKTAEKIAKRKTWGERLYERRMQLGFSQAQVAHLSGLTQQTISRIEADATLTRFYNLDAISSSLGTTTEELFPWVSRPRRAS